MQIDISEIQSLLSAEDYDAICRGDDAVAEESLESARSYVSLAAEKFGIEYDENDPALRLAVKKYALAQMYIFAAEWETAEKYKKECNEILAPLAPARGRIFSEALSGSRDWKGYR